MKRKTIESLRAFLRSLSDDEIMKLYRLVVGKPTRQTSLLPHDLMCEIEATICGHLDAPARFA